MNESVYPGAHQSTSLANFIKIHKKLHPPRRIIYLCRDPIKIKISLFDFRRIKLIESIKSDCIQPDDTEHLLDSPVVSRNLTESKCKLMRKETTATRSSSYGNINNINNKANRIPLFFP